MVCGAIQSVRFSSAIYYGRRDEILGSLAYGQPCGVPTNLVWYEPERTTKPNHTN
jgi:hypothetical protein